MCLIQVSCQSWNWFVAQFPSLSIPSFSILHNRFALVPFHYLSQLIYQYCENHVRELRTFFTLSQSRVKRPL